MANVRAGEPWRGEEDGRNDAEQLNEASPLGLLKGKDNQLSSRAAVDHQPTVLLWREDLQLGVSVASSIR